MPICAIFTTAKNTEISPIFLVWIFCETVQFLQSFGWYAQTYVETVPFYKISPPGNQMQFRYFTECCVVKTAKFGTTWPMLNACLSWSFVTFFYFQFLKIFLRIFVMWDCWGGRTRRVTSNFLRPGSFLGIRAFSSNFWKMAWRNSLPSSHWLHAWSTDYELSTNIFINLLKFLCEVSTIVLVYMHMSGDASGAQQRQGGGTSPCHFLKT